MRLLLVLALLPLSGGSADQGRWIQQGLELAAAEINAADPGSVQLLYEDTGGSSARAISAYRQQRLRKGVPAVITWGSGVGLALHPLVNADEVIQIGVATAASSYSSPDDYNFRNFPTAERETAFLSQSILGQLSISRVGILRQNTDYGVSCAEAFRRSFSARGGTVVLEEELEPGDRDFRPQLLRLKRSAVRLIYLASYSTAGALVLRQARELGLTARFIASVAILGDQQFFRLAGSAAEGLLVATSAPHFSQSDSPTVRRFARMFTNRYGEKLHAGHLYAARAYDALHVLHRAHKRCGSPNTACMRSSLQAMRQVEGAAGQLTIDQYGDVQAQFNLQLVRGGEFVSYASK